jgi:hypothetical protein
MYEASRPPLHMRVVQRYPLDTCKETPAYKAKINKATSLSLRSTVTESVLYITRFSSVGISYRKEGIKLVLEQRQEPSKNQADHSDTDYS